MYRLNCNGFDNQGQIAVVGRRLPGSFHSSPSEMIGHHGRGGHQDIIRRVALRAILGALLVAVIKYPGDLQEKEFILAHSLRLQSAMVCVCVGGGVADKATGS